jgi:hypothetical protein
MNASLKEMYDKITQVMMAPVDATAMAPIDDRVRTTVNASLAPFKNSLVELDGKITTVKELLLKKINDYGGWFNWLQKGVDNHYSNIGHQKKHISTRMDALEGRLPTLPDQAPDLTPTPTVPATIPTAPDPVAATKAMPPEPATTTKVVPQH